jgi:2-keto-4-pentenoate hydratase
MTQAMTSAAIKEAADFLWQTRVQKRRIDALSDQMRPHNLAQGYAIQDAMVASARQPVAGWKIAATSTAGQEHIGVTEPLSGRLFADFILKSDVHLPAGPLLMRVIEAEFAFRMGRALPSRAEEYRIAEVCAAVEALHLAIEVPDARFNNFDTIGPAQIVADDAFASWFVLGPRVSNWTDIDLSKQTARALKNGKIVAEGSGANALGDPRLALTWIANHLSKRGIGLKPADIITTGTCIKPAEIGPGDHMIADFPGLGRVSVAFD